MLDLYLIACTGLTLAAACADLGRIGSAFCGLMAALATFFQTTPLTRHKPQSSRGTSPLGRVKPAATADLLPSRGGLFDQAMARARQQRMADWLAERDAA